MVIQFGAESRDWLREQGDSLVIHHSFLAMHHHITHLAIICFTGDAAKHWGILLTPRTGRLRLGGLGLFFFKRPGLIRSHLPTLTIEKELKAPLRGYLGGLG